MAAGIIGGLLEILVDRNDGFERQIFDARHRQRLRGVDEERVRRAGRGVAFRLDDDEKAPTLEPVANEAAVGQNDGYFLAVRRKGLVDNRKLN